MDWRSLYDTWRGEKRKLRAENRLAKISSRPEGRSLVAVMRGGPRVRSRKLQTKIAGMTLENPLLVGPGWDKQGRAVDGLYDLGFAGTEVGSVLMFPQAGNTRPRFWHDRHNGVALNRFGFNTVGIEAAAANLDRLERRGIVGINVSKNKLLPDDYAPWAHAAAIEQLYLYGDYFVINVSSPNTPGLRTLLNPKPLTNIVRAANEVLDRLGRKPLFIKTAVDLAIKDINKIIEVCATEKVEGIIDSNTTIDDRLKAKYGWKGQMGGLSGDDIEYRRRVNDRMKHIAKISRGSSLQLIGVGGIVDAATAIERLKAGAQALQIVTAFWPLKPKLATEINRDILNYLKLEKLKSVQDLIGADT